MEKMTETFNDTLNETHAELHCGDLPDLEKMKVMFFKCHIQASSL